MSSTYRSNYSSQNSRVTKPAPATVAQVASDVSAPVIAANTADMSTSGRVRSPTFSWKHFAANIMYILSFLFLIVLTVLIWVMQSRITEPGAQTPGASFNVMLTTCAILGTLALLMLFLSVIYYKPGLVGYNHYKKHYAHL